MTRKILVVEDDQDILSLIEWHLKAEGYQALTEHNGRTGLDTALRERPDLIILDLMLPGMDGLEVCKMLKKSEATESIPVIMLTAKGEEVDRIVGFELGADDYMVKPFSPRELLLRIKAIIRRAETADGKPVVIRHHTLAIDPEKHAVTINELPVELTLTEYNLLFELVQNKGRVRTRDHLLNRVWGYQFEGYHRTVDTHIRRLRQKLGQLADNIETVRGIGYRFKE
jgi:DNA-binding response OmpR family regulator